MACSNACFGILCLNFIVLISGEGNANRFLRAGALSKKVVQDELLSELSGKYMRPGQKERVAKLEEDLRPMFNALPKDEHGNLEHSVMRYALHRLLAKEHGWFVIGLEPERDGHNMSVSSIRAQLEWAPSYLQDLLESRMRGRVGLHELAVLADTLEDLVHREAVGRLDAIYDIYNLSKTEPLSPAHAAQVIDSYSLVYFKGGNWTAQSASEAFRRLNIFKKNHKHWEP